MNRSATLLIVIVFIFSGATAQDKILLETKHFQFHSNPVLNIHLFLYKHATAVKKLPEDSLHFYLSNQAIPYKKGNYAKLIAAIKYYRDSLTQKDMLFDSTMRKFSVMLAIDKEKNVTGWQVQALKHIRKIEPFFKKELWPSIDSSNREWINKIKGDLDLHENFIIDRLQQIYKDSMPKEKIRIDLATYAGWAGAYSYSQGIHHIVISNEGRLNQGRWGMEIVFHEGSHFIIDSVYNLLAEYFAVRTPSNTRRQTWHNLLFYTTGHVVREAFAKDGIEFSPYYKEAKFEERPLFKLSTDAFALYWNPYMRGETNMEDALKKVVEHIASNEK